MNQLTVARCAVFWKLRARKQNLPNLILVSDAA